MEALCLESPETLFITIGKQSSGRRRKVSPNMIRRIEKVVLVYLKVMEVRPMLPV